MVLERGSNTAAHVVVLELWKGKTLSFFQQIRPALWLGETTGCDALQWTAMKLPRPPDLGTGSNSTVNGMHFNGASLTYQALSGRVQRDGTGPVVCL